MRPRFAHLENPRIDHDAGDTSAANEILEPVFECARESASLLASRRTVIVGETEYELPQFLLLGARGGGVPIRIGLYGGLDAEQLDTVIAVSRLLLQLELSPKLAQDFAIFAYPVVNAAGFGWEGEPLSSFRQRFAHGRDADVQFFQNELATWKPDGLIFLRSSGANAALSATVRSTLLAEEVVTPALEALSPSIPVAPTSVKVLPDSSAARTSDFQSGRLLPHPVTSPWPFEIELFAPDASAEIRVRALFLAVVEILRRYRSFVAHAGSL